MTEITDSMLIGDPEKRDIQIVAYYNAWPTQFEHHAGVVSQALGESMVAVHHVGSTSVPGLAAKPIVDILVVVADSSDERSYLPALELAGYVLRVREPDWHQHRMLRAPEKDVHIHVFSADSPEIRRNLLFRDRLRSHHADRKRYEETKRRLASQSWPDMNAYAAAKTVTSPRQPSPRLRLTSALHELSPSNPSLTDSANGVGCSGEARVG